jgi:hypothetical protein
MALSFSTFLLLSLIAPVPTAHAQSGDFSIRTILRGVGLPQGSSYNYNEVNVTSLNGFTGSVSLAAAVSPIVVDGPQISFYNQVIIVTPVESNLTIIDVSTVSSTPTENFTVTITATSGNLSHTTSFWVSVNVPYEPPGFSISANPPVMTARLVPHTVQDYNSTLTLVSLAGFAGDVSLSFISLPGPAIVITPSTVSLKSGGTANATLTIQPYYSGNYTVNVLAGSSGYSGHSVTVTLNILPPASDVAKLSYQLSYNSKPAPGETLILTNTLTNQGAALVTVTGLSFSLGSGSSATLAGLPLNLTSGESEVLSATIQIPPSTRLGNETLVATLEWKYYASAQGIWSQGPTTYTSGNISVTESPLSGPAGQIADLMGLMTGLAPWLIIAGVAAAASASILIIRSDRKKQRSLRPAQLLTKD